MCYIPAASVQQLFQQEISSEDHQPMMCFAVPCPELMGAKAL